MIFLLTLASEMIGMADPAVRAAALVKLPLATTEITIDGVEWLTML